MKLYSIVFCLILTLINITNLAAQDWKIYNGDNFTIRYPPTWELNKSGSMNTLFVIMSPSEGPEDKISENLSLIVQDMGSQAINLDQYVGLSTSQVTAQLKDGSILINERKSNDGNEYHKLIYSGKMGDLHLAFNQHVRIKDNKVYVLNFTCEFSKITQWQSIGEEIMNTFKFN